MESEQMATMPRHECEVASGAGCATATDAELLQLFVTQGNESAFATLVRRHGPLVLGVCRRVLKEAHDAEDAFQATFLVLVRKASSLRNPELLSNWLYGVAYRIARKLRTTMETRRRHEARHLHPAFTISPTYGEQGDLRPILDEELLRLPEKYRLAVILCYLEGKTNEEAAQQLHWPTGTVKGRLARARDMLRHRLVRRGLTLAALGLLTDASLGLGHLAKVGGTLLESTQRGALSFARGSTATSGRARALAEGFLGSQRLMRRGVVLAALLGVLGLGLGAAASESWGRSAETSPKPSKRSAEKSPKAGKRPVELSHGEPIARPCQ